MDDAPHRIEPAPGPAEDMRPQGGPAPHHGPGHELSDVSVRGIFIFTAFLAAFAVVFHVGFAMVMAHFGARADDLEKRRPPRYEDQAGQFPTPNLQEAPNADMALMRIEEKAEVSGYEWIDPEDRVARIPLSRALDIVAAKYGWTAPEPVTTDAAAIETRLMDAAARKKAEAAKQQAPAKKDEGTKKQAPAKKDEGTKKQEPAKKDEATKKQEPASQ